MAATSSNKMEYPDPDWNLLQADLPINQVDWDLVKTYLFDRFSTPPTEFLNRQGQTVIEDVHSTQICEHIMHLRPCPSFFDDSYQCHGFHPEFLLQVNDVIWTPRTWSCRAFQRRSDLATQDHCHVPGCQQLHRPGWAHSEMVAFRSWVLRVNRAHWFTIYCRQPNVNGKSPLYIVHYQDIFHCLVNQGYLPYSSCIKHAWKETVEPPLTYIHDQPSQVQPFAANYYDEDRVQQRRALHRQRSQTPRRPRHRHPGSILAHRSPIHTSGEPSSSSLWDRDTSSLSTTHWIHQPKPDYILPNSIFQSDIVRTTHTSSQCTRATTHQRTLLLRFSAPPNWEPSTALQTSLRSAHQSFFTQPIPRAYYRDFSFAPFADWQMPTRLLDDTFSALRQTYSDPNSSVTMTWWGLLSRQNSLHSDRREYSEQTLIIPLPTNTADPEVAILTSFFYTKMNEERALAFQRNPNDPVATTRRPDSITMLHSDFGPHYCQHP